MPEEIAVPEESAVPEEIARPFVRLAERREAAPVAALHLRTALTAYRHIFPAEAPPPTGEEVLAQWEHWLGAAWDQGWRVFVADDRGTVVGVVLAGPDPVDEHRGQVARLYVAPERWADGIGRQLHDAALTRLCQQGFTSASLWVLEHNARARSWYERLGWRPTGARTPTYEPAGIDDVGYELDLDACSSLCI